MKLRCDCGWEGQLWEAALSMAWDVFVVSCPSCHIRLRIRTRTETKLEYEYTDAEGVSRYVGEEKQ